MWSFDDVYRVFVDARTDPMPGTVGGGNTNNNPTAVFVKGSVGVVTAHSRGAGSNYVSHRSR